VIRNISLIIAVMVTICFGQSLFKAGGDARLSPRLLNYQGYLTDTLGNPITNPSVSMSFAIFDAVSAGNQKWTETQPAVVVNKGIFSVLLGSVTPIPDSVFLNSANRWLQLIVAGQVLTPRTRITANGYAYTSTYSDTAEYARNAAAINLDARYVNVQGPDSIYAVTHWTFKAKGDTAGYFVGEILVTDKATIGPNTNTGTYAFVAGASNAVSNSYTTVSGGYINAASGNYATVSGGCIDTANGDYATAGGGMRNTASGDYATVGGGFYNKARSAFSGALSGRNNYAGADSTDSCAVVSGGRGNGATAIYSSVAGGYSNTASGRWSTVGGGYAAIANGDYATVGGGANNLAGYYYTTVGGGYYNTADGYGATVGGGYAVTANGDYAAVGGGADNNASGNGATVSGGYADTASGELSTVGGGYANTASGDYATVDGGYAVTASGDYAAVGGGRSNTVSGSYATVGGGYSNSSSANYSFTVGNNSDVPLGHDNSAAFNGQTTTASGQTRVGVLSKASGTFTIDHPLDPENKILNHYFVESPEMVLLYRGFMVLGENGRAEVRLPDYFDALNDNPMIQVSGVGSSDVYIADDVKDNRFTIGGKPGIKVYWTVTGLRKDPSAEITKIIMPVEQPKEGGLTGRSFDDEFLVSTMAQLERMGKASGFKFRHASEQKRYEEMKRMMEASRE